jgi:septum formation protein
VSDAVPPLVLASSSPRRVALLSAAGWRFEAVAPGVDEDAVGGGVASPSGRAVAIALAKAQAGAALRPGRFVIAADTLVVLDEEALGKPRDAAEALWMLSRLSGASHEVVTGVAAIAPDGRSARAFETTQVVFARIPGAALLALAGSPAALDKAGAYGIQEAAGAWVERVVGSQPNVVGLPWAALKRVLAGVDAPGGPW